MATLEKNKATLCIVQYKTLEMTRLCLRSIRKFTKYPYKVLVVDNGSQDESTEYLRSLDWIELIERTPEEGEVGGIAHAVGLQTGLEACRTEFFASMHSDTLVCREGWLEDLIARFDKPEVACVGTGKIELTPVWRQWLQKATDFRTFRRKLFRTPDPLGKYRYYNRTICSLYRTEILKRENLSFVMDRDKGLTAGKKLYFELEDRGYGTVVISPRKMSRSIVHLAHATQAVNPQEFTLRSRTLRKYNRFAQRILRSDLFREIMSDDLLDR